MLYSLSGRENKFHNFKKVIKKKEKMIYLVLYLKASSGFLLPTS